MNVKPFDSKSRKVASEVIREIEKMMPNIKVMFMGSAALGVAGQNDIDLSMVSNGNFDKDRSTLLELFGSPTHDNSRFVQWDFEREGFPVDLSLNRKMSPQIKEQIDTFNLLSSNSSLKNEYEQIKLAMDGKSKREYQVAKYEFYNRILSPNAIISA